LDHYLPYLFFIRADAAAELAAGPVDMGGAT
jgi:hypothetical protein